jgi:hypothetical protein
VGATFRGGWISDAVGSCCGAHDDEYYSRLELSDDSDIEDSLLFFQQIMPSQGKLF